MRVVFMGTPEFAQPALEALMRSKHEVVLVITQPDRPKGRGQKLEPPVIKQVAEKHGLPVFQPTRAERGQIADRLREARADVAIVAAFGMILPRAVLEATRFGCLNIHPSLLPAYRGAAPVQRCLLEGNDYTGVTIMQLVEELDAGPIVAQQRIDILPDDDARSVLDLTAVMGAEMLVRVLDEGENAGLIEGEAQNDEEATYAPPIEKEEGLAPWEDPTDEIMFRLRALAVWPGLFSFIDGEKQLNILQAEPLWSNEAEELGKMNKVTPGTVTGLIKGFGFSVKTGDGHLLVTRVQPAGKGAMDGQDFINGRGIEVGQKLEAKKATAGT